LLEKHKVPIIIFLVGTILVGAGILAVIAGGREKPKIEILTEEENGVSEAIFVDIQGAVEKPGVYKLTKDSRVEELLVAAGGLSASADREWVAKFLNRAQKLSDGVKIYIPDKGETLSNSSTTHQNVAGAAVSQVNINTASASELEALWGIGPATASKIIENRPYQSVEELLNRKILKSNVYKVNKDKLTLF